MGENSGVSEKLSEEAIAKIKKASDEAIAKIKEARGKKKWWRLVRPEIYTVWTVIAWTIFSAAGLMAFSLLVRMVDPSFADATKDVLPLATALVGFAGGVVTAIFGKEAAANAATNAATNANAKTPANTDNPEESSE